MSINAVVLAAGQGTRMKSRRHKVLHPVCGKPMIRHILDALQTAGITRPIVVIGSLGEQVQAALGDDVEFVWQKEQLGTGHAVMQVAPLLESGAGITLVCTGDTPLITADTFKNLIELHQQKGAAVTVLSGLLDNPFGYGRIIRGDDGSVLRIVEEKDASAEEKAVREINSGTYCFDTPSLLEALKHLTNDNAQGEYYLTDCIDILRRQGRKVAAYCATDADEIMGVNDRIQLAVVEQLLREKIRRDHMRNGVTLLDPSSVYIDTDVKIGADTVIYPGTFLTGFTEIGSGCEIGPNTQIQNCTLGDGSVVIQSVLIDSTFGAGVNIGPFAYVRPGSKVSNNVKIGDFVEVKNSTIGEGSKIPHLSYVGDADIGSNTNIGCGTITVNYDGITKHRTVVGNNSFIGCNTNLVAPVAVGDNSYVAAGSTITDHVPDGALAIAREKQVTKEGYKEKLEAKLRERRPEK
ncbi:bifunctional UDP-N-acetylglucosamine diphosphorylase/glucosamine-1-phosphate N-acetyltransferase GlmU [Effusibacillus lacus]|uniref:Bifunctional protein GlmU n=1 Tax=Effusibacillus lacus TaxID=1348429 RepID=A0A292YGT8_9BACL|nr:bifunctional UDP-N-acetylglucosamine diphosphorylase/glucosamine-1-phosphate N-acetyltransferase GlmU [Effusibacillus lacus]TCS74458.1 UDP-N-acetylglucosamine pyrophosphorylase /glucosamine-1-phosphate N-acetyltransferase [Effusibacillus lacus]GAX88668.1 bifunctional N-acetylglucosamine-1-phosphate uridyltransferase/glucosamine-1-phosphate acetyltransferase [Effusibacillus lacus]